MSSTCFCGTCNCSAEDVCFSSGCDCCTYMNQKGQYIHALLINSIGDEDD